MEIKVRVKANSKRNEIKKEKDFYKVSVKSRAVENKANKELIKILSKYFKKKVKIIKGLKSRDKVVEVKN